MFDLLKNHVHFVAQPIKNVGSEKDEFYEMLCRVSSVKKISPMHFIENIKKIEADKDFIGYSIEQGSFFSKVTGKSFSVNVDAENLDEYVMDTICKECENNGIDPKKVVVEVTEGNIHLSRAFRMNLEKLRNIGCKIALDDFGSGMNNIDALFFYDYDYVKIDGGIIRNILNGNYPDTILYHIAELISETNSSPIIEHIENDQMLRFAKEHGIYLMQGWHIGKEIPISKILTE